MGRIVAVAFLALAVSAAAQSSIATLTLTTKPSPLGLGQNLFEVAVKDAKGRPVTNAEVALLMVMPADPKTKHPEMRTEGTLNNVGGGKYNGIAIVTMAGEWDVTVTARRDGKVLGEKKARLTAYAKTPAPKSRSRNP
jgi:nitrogen fixation protein FixH